MKEKLRYCQTLIERRKVARAVVLLAEVDHPDAQTIIFEIATSTTDDSETIAATLIDNQTQAAWDILHEEHLELCLTRARLISKLHTVDDDRFFVAVLERLQTQVKKARQKHAGYVLEEKRGDWLLYLAKKLDARAVPILIEMLQLFDMYEEDRQIATEKVTYPILKTLKAFDHPAAKQAIETFEQQRAIIYQRLFETDAIFWKLNYRLVLNRHLVNHSLFIDYIVTHLDALSLTVRLDWLKSTSVKFINRIDNQDQRWRIIKRWFSFRLAFLGQDQRKEIFASVQSFSDERLTLIARQYLNVEALTASCLKIINQHPHLFDEQLYQQITHILETRMELDLTDERIQMRDDHAIIEYAIHILGKFQRQQSVPLLQRMIDTYRDTSLAKALYTALLKCTGYTDQTLDVLVDALHDKRNDLYFWLVIHISRFGRRALPVLLELLSSHSRYRKYAIDLLGDLKYPEAIPYLMNVLIYAEGLEQQNIVYALEKIGTEPAYAALNAWIESQSS